MPLLPVELRPPAGHPALSPLVELLDKSLVAIIEARAAAELSEIRRLAQEIASAPREQPFPNQIIDRLRDVTEDWINCSEDEIPEPVMQIDELWQFASGNSVQEEDGKFVSREDYERRQLIENRIARIDWSAEPHDHNERELRARILTAAAGYA